MADQLATIRRRLERWELKHLRQHAADLAARLESAQEDARRENECAEYWRESFFDLQQELFGDGGELGLTKEGQILVIKKPEAE